jgi:pimeloyl-ACP methyl ester carboxylesterase
LTRYGEVKNRVIGQIWDSPAHPLKAIVAIPLALFPDNKIMHSLVSGLLWLHLKLYPALTRHYYDGLGRFLKHSKAPALLMTSKPDPVSTPEFVDEIAQTWKSNDVDVTVKVFEDSPHIKHFQKYSEEYTKLMHENWKKSKLL